MQYKLGDGEWGGALPTATAVGDYTVYYKVTVPSGATVRINGIRLTGGAADPVTPAFAEGGEAVTTKFEKGEGDTWKITAWSEIDNDI